MEQLLCLEKDWTAYKVIFDTPKQTQLLLSSMNEWINVLVWVEFVGIYIILYSVILILRLINVISVGNGWIWRGRQDRLWWWWQRIQGEGQRQGGQSCCSLQRLRLSCSCSSPLRSRVLLLVSSILQTDLHKADNLPSMQVSYLTADESF